MTATRAVVAGLGKTGHSVIRHLLARGWHVTATDTRAAPPGLEELRAMAPGLRVELVWRQLGDIEPNTGPIVFASSDLGT